MSAFSNYVEEQILNWTLRGAALSARTSVYIALFTGPPGEDGTANEVNPATSPWSNYERQDAADGASIELGWSVPASGAVATVSTNSKAIEFPANNGGASVTVTHVGLFDNAVGGNFLYGGALESQKTLNPGDVLSFKANTLEVSVA